MHLSILFVETNGLKLLVQKVVIRVLRLGFIKKSKNICKIVINDLYLYSNLK
jgi:hypothetical protein